MDGVWAGWRATLARASDLLPNVSLASLPLPVFHLSNGLARKVAQLSTALLLSSAVVRDDKEWLRWCGKHYEVGSPADDPGGQWVTPEPSKVPLLDFRCIPAEQPYLESDPAGALIFDVSTSYTHGQPMLGLAPGEAFHGELVLEVFATGAPGDSAPTSTTLLFNTTITAPVQSLELAFDLASLKASGRPYRLACSVRSAVGQTFAAESELRFLPPNPYGGSTVKLDRRTGGLLVQQQDDWKPLLPTGFYTVFSGYLEADHAVMDDMVAQGYNTLHVIPPDGHIESIVEVLRYAETAGLYIMIDLRHAYFDPKLVQDAAIAMRSSKSLLLWYTADEPDGTQDQFAGVTAAYDQLYALDGYHPVSLVLNCGDYHFAEYTRGTDILLVDTYSFNVNTTFSSEYGTECNATYGCCGCDNCFAGDPFLDITDRLDRYSAMRTGLARERNLTLWAVPQAFSEAFWSAKPTAEQFQAGVVLGLIHGAKGILPWNAPTSAAINATFSVLARHLSATLAPRLLSRTATDSVTVTPSPGGVHARAWLDTQTHNLLVLVANPTDERAPLTVRLHVSVPAEVGRLPRAGRARDVLDDGARVWVVEERDGALELSGVLGPLGTGAWLVADE